MIFRHLQHMLLIHVSEIYYLSVLSSEIIKTVKLESFGVLGLKV